MSTTDPAADRGQRTDPSSDLGPLPPFLRPLVDAVARSKATVHTKLLAGFLVIALLLLTMGVVCVVVLERIDSQVVKLTALSNQVNQARQMIYEVTAQSHYRAMALLTDEQAWTDKIYAAKREFDANLAEIQTYSIPSQPDFFNKLSAANETYRTSSDEVTQLVADGQHHAALLYHINKEHPQSHVLEDSLNELIAQSQTLFAAETASFAGHRRFLTAIEPVGRPGAGCGSFVVDHPAGASRR
jgi:CHASE3 domain sensor protein